MIRGDFLAADESNPLRRFGFAVSLVYVFFRFGFVHEIIANKLGVNVYFYPLVAMPLVFIAFASGSFRRTMSALPSRLWLIFAAWMAVAAVMSTWKSDSIQVWLGYLQISLSSLLIVGGLTLTLKECKQMMATVALGGVFNTFSGRFLIDVSRTGSDFQGSVGNANDWAAHLLFVIPFLLHVVMTSKSKLYKVVALISMGTAFVLGANAGSRGAMLAIGVMILFTFLRGAARVRIAITFLVPLLALIALVSLPESLLKRYATTFGKEDEGSLSEAEASAETRKYLFQTSVKLTLENPIFGVGPAQFSNIEGQNAKAVGKQGAWQVTHNAYTQVSSETGFPGLLIFIGAIVLTYRMLSRAMKQSRKHPQLQQMANACFCLMLSLIGCSAAIVFLSWAY